MLDPVSTASGLAGRTGAYCTWSPKDAAVFRNATLVVHSIATDAKAQFESDRTQPGAKPAPGIGDAAFVLVASPGSNSTLSFEKGAWIVDLNVSGADWVVTESMLTSIATPCRVAALMSRDSSSPQARDRPTGSRGRRT